MKGHAETANPKSQRIRHESSVVVVALKRQVLVSGKCSADNEWYYLEQQWFDRSAHLLVKR